MLRLSVPPFKADYFLSSGLIHAEGDSGDSESGVTRYFSFTKSNTKIAHTPTVMGNCAREASCSAPPLGRIYVAAIIARAVSTARISLFQFMRVGLPFPFGTSRIAAIVHVFCAAEVLSPMA